MPQLRRSPRLLPPLLSLLLTCLAHAQPTPSTAAPAPVATLQFPTDIVLAQGDAQVNGGRAVLYAGEPGKIDIAWADKDAGLRYTAVDLTQRQTRDGRVIDAEPVCGLTHHILGIGRDAKGVVRIGANNGKNINEWTRTDSGKWQHSSTKVTCAQYYGAVAAYSLGANGRGAFAVIDAQKQAVIVQRNSTDEWVTDVLATNLDNVARVSIAVLNDGAPVAAFQRLNPSGDILVGSPKGVAIGTSNAHRYFPLAIAADAGDRLHMIVAHHTSLIRYHRSNDKGKTFADVAELARSANYGDAAYLAAAASPDGKRVAALLPTGKNGLTLVTLHGGAARAEHDLPGGKTQHAAVGYDRAGELYVVYFNSDDKTLRLRSTAGTVPPALKR